MEFLISTAIAVILMTTAVPSLHKLIEKKVLIQTVEAAYQQMILARSEAIRLRTPVFATFSSTNDGVAWAFGLNEASGCDPTVTDPDDTSACALDENGTPVIRAIRSNSYKNIKLQSASFGDGNETRFEHVRGTASDGMGIFYNGAARFRSQSGYKLEIQVSKMGRIKVCLPSGSLPLSGYPSC